MVIKNNEFKNLNVIRVRTSLSLMCISSAKGSRFVMNNIMLWENLDQHSVHSLCFSKMGETIGRVGLLY